MMYLCKVCSNKLSDKSDRCPQCGDPDPFYQKEIEEMRRKHIENVSIFYKISDKSQHY